ncbi:hypothetical protein CPR19088_GLDEOEPO_01871 [Companilactobacillus paralimentarius]
MKEKNTSILFTIGIFAALLTFIYFSNNVKATINRYDFDDGITKWYQPSNIINQVAQLPISENNLQLGYTFGLAQNTSGKVVSGGDGTIQQNSLSTGDNTSFSKMNVFLNNKSNYISSIFQGGYSSDLSNKENVSITSPDFMIVPSNSNGSKGISSDAFNVLGNPGSNNGTGNTGLSSKQFFYGKDKNGNPAYKIMGYFNRKNNSGLKNGNYNMEVELLLRASPTKSAIVQREMYVKNLDTTPAEFVTLFGEDTKIGDSSGGNDNVTVKDLGNKKGIYIEDLYNGSEYRLMVTNQIPDGFDSYNGQLRVKNWAAGLKNGLITGTGAEADNNTKGTWLTKTGDSAYVLKWNSKTLKPGAIAHFGSTMGVTSKPYSIPTATKTYINETRPDDNGINKVGDKLKFTLQLTNNGYGSQWNAKEIVDHIPKGLQIDTKSVTKTSGSFLDSQSEQSDYDETTRTLTVPTPYKLTDGMTETVTFEATLTSEALQNLDSNLNLTNTADFLGSDHNISPNITDTFHASTSFPVSYPDYNYTFKKQIKNITNNEEYQDSTTAKSGDRIGYQIIYRVETNSKDYLIQADTINDVLPNGLTLDKDSIRTQGADGQWYSQHDGINTGLVKTLRPGQQVTIQFEVNVTSSAVGILTNNAYITNVITDNANTKYDKQISTDAILNIKKINAFISTPKNIDFGSTKMYGKEKTLQNISTDGELIISHPDSDSFKVNVFYDNTDPHNSLVNANGETIPTDNSKLLFIKQRNNTYDDPGDWQPILPSGTSIQKAPFKGNQQSLNLTKYIGVNDWQIKLAANTPSGIYKGTLTWGLTESV